jgi:hypothetical protein
MVNAYYNSESGRSHFLKRWNIRIAIVLQVAPSQPHRSLVPRSTMREEIPLVKAQYMREQEEVNGATIVRCPQMQGRGFPEWPSENYGTAK